MADRQRVERGKRHALLIEADDAYRAAMAECVRLGGCSVEQVSSLDLAFAALDGTRFDLVVWGGVTSAARRHGVAVVQLRARIDAPLLLVDGGFETPEVAVAIGAEHWLPKPFVPGALVDAVRAVLRSSAAPEVSEQWSEFSAALRRRPAAGGPAGNGKRLAALSSRGPDVTLFGPSGGSGRGWAEVGLQLGSGATRFRGGVTHEVLAEHVSGDLACTVEIMCYEEVVAGSEESRTFELRVTMVYRRERGQWKIVHSHADPLVAEVPGPAE